MRTAAQAWDEFYSNLSTARRIEGPENIVQEELPPEVRLLYREKALLDQVERVLGPNFGLCYARLAIKDKLFNKEFGAHQDFPYFMGFEDKLSVFITITPCHVQNGALGFVKRSHLLGHIGRGNIEMGLFPQLEVMRPDLQPGDCIFNNFYTWHMSDELDTDDFSERALYQLFFAPAHRPEVREILRGEDSRPEFSYEQNMIEAQEDIYYDKWQNAERRVEEALNSRAGPRGVVEQASLQSGYCYAYRLPGDFSDTRNTGILLEDGVPLMRVVTDHGRIREHGHGLYSFWGGHLYFSSSDGTSPLENGRTYAWVLLT